MRLENEWVRKVHTYGRGDSFGEIALLKNKARSATVICTKDTKFATLSRKTYLKILGNQQKKELKEIVKFFRNFRIFQHIKSSSIEKMRYQMVRKEFKRG